MKLRAWVLLCLLAGVVALPLRASEVDQLKSDLIGQCMGGREKCWKFQSLDQIKDLVVKSKTEEAERRVYIIALKLQATQSSSQYSAEARVEYAKVGTGWKVRHVGLLAIAKMQ